jgi:hypothetical protein
MIAVEGKLVPPKTRAKVDAAFKSMRVVCHNLPKNVEQAVLPATAAVVVLAEAWRAIR